ncbi:3'-phosphoesterase [Candidatus Gottesmanbacteria bacterium]|nr:3'-phosphoesterase [Candidatus Gottesmanbacteria bacterium]
MDRSRNRFVVHEHHATRLHWDFRLEMPQNPDGSGSTILKSWAVPKGPPVSDKTKRLAMQTPDHPQDYIDFEGILPEGTYGAGEVKIWDSGTYELESRSETEYKFTLHGQKLRGSFALFHPKTFQNGQFLFIKH